MKNNSKLWTKDFLIISSANLFIFLTFYILVVTLSLFTTEKFNASQSEAGLASGIFVLGAVVARPFAGKWIDLIGRKKMLFIGLLLFLVGTIAYFFVTSLPLLIMNRFIHGIAFGISSTATGTIVAEIIPNERRGEGTGYFAMSTNVAMAIGPFLGLIISQKMGFTMVFVVSSVFAIFGLIACFFLSVPNTALPKVHADSLKGFRISDFFEKKVIPISLVVMIIGFTYSSILTFLTPFTKEINLLHVASYFFVVYAGFLLASRPFTGRLLDIKGDNFVIYPCFLLYFVGIIVLSQSEQTFPFLLSGAIIGVGYGTLVSGTQAIAVKVAPRHRIGLATSTYYVFYDFGIGIGPFLMGYIIPLTKFRGLYLVMAVIIAGSAFLYYFLHGRKTSYQHELGKAS